MEKKRLNFALEILQRVTPDLTPAMQQFTPPPITEQRLLPCTCGGFFHATLTLGKEKYSDTWHVVACDECGTMRVPEAVILEFEAWAAEVRAR
jgi:hypothetical protein